MKPVLVPALMLATVSLGLAQNLVEPQKPQTPGVVRQFVFVQAPKLKIGDRAPLLKPSKWVKGTGPNLLGNGKITVVNFWATWCAPSHQALPEIAELAQKYKGKVDFVGISVLESPEDVEAGRYVKNVEGFVQKQGAKMPYAVAVDDAQGSIYKTWIEAAAQSIPSTYIVDRNGRIAWVGHPLADLSDVLPKVLSGKYDTVKAANEQTIRFTVEGQLRDAIVPVQVAVTTGTVKDAVAAIDRAIGKNRELEVALGPTRFQMLLRSDETAAYAYMKTLANGVCKDVPTALNLLAWTVVEEDSGLKKPDYPSALAIAKRASELTQHSDPYILDTYALALFRTGDREKALELQTRAVLLGDAKKEIDRKILGEMRERLERYKRANNP